MHNVSREQGNMAKIKKEQGNFGSYPGIGEIVGMESFSRILDFSCAILK